jgi:hypothetical protein
LPGPTGSVGDRWRAYARQGEQPVADAPSSDLEFIHRLTARLGELIVEQVQPTVASAGDSQRELLYLSALFGMNSFEE